LRFKVDSTSFDDVALLDGVIFGAKVRSSTSNKSVDDVVEYDHKIFVHGRKDSFPEIVADMQARLDEHFLKKLAAKGDKDGESVWVQLRMQLDLR
jgi:hypothetical protein